MGVSSDEYGKGLDALLSRVTAPDRSVVMFECHCYRKLCLLPMQRRLSAKYRVSLIPKRYFAQVIGDANATTDGLRRPLEHDRWRPWSHKFCTQS